MRFDDLTTDAAVLADLGRRLERHRIERNVTQSQLAEEAGIGRATLQRLERGESVQMTSMVKVLRALGLLGALDAAVPEPVESPIARLEQGQRRRRQRASRPRSTPRSDVDVAPWIWGSDRRSDL